MTPKNGVLLAQNLDEFFQHEVHTAQAHLGLELSQLTEHYIVQLLCNYSRQETVPTTAEPLALMYQKAAEASFEQRLQLLKQLGDLALYVSGFFTESVEKSLVDIDYYIAMGGNAYGHLSGLVGTKHRQREDLAAMYGQLSQRFTALVDLLNEISDKHREVDKNTELLKLYDRWLRTGSERVRKILLEKGLTPNSTIKTEFVQ